MSTDSSPEAASSAGARYSLTFVNNSSQSFSGCVYQRDPDLGVPDAMSLAWLARMAAPRASAVFQWALDYSFVCGETGMLVPGLLFQASQMWRADLSTANQVTFSDAGGFYTFQNQRQGPNPGSLFIVNDSTIPPNQAAVGIGMSGSPVYAVQAQPNWNLVFTPHPHYWITFGNYTQGEVLDAGSISGAVQIEFPTNVYSMTAVLNDDYTWSVRPT